MVTKGPRAFYDPVVLTLIYRAEDNFNKGLLTKIGITEWLCYDDEDYVIKAAWNLILQAYRHEAGEQFYVDGKLPYNEHDTDFS